MENMNAPSESTPQGPSSELSQSSTTKTFLLKENEEVHDECFVVRKTRFGLFVSTKLDGEQVITAPTAESCLLVTRFHLKGEQEGWPEDPTLSTYSNSVGVKL
tara:strand:- start:2747 stop:3055 length:309 start_codon:yes stop_codon:yes gene_type:complete